MTHNSKNKKVIMFETFYVDSEKYKKIYSKTQL